MRHLAISIVLLFALAEARPANAYPCDLVLRYRAEITSMPRSERRKWIKRLKVTPEEIKQARACLRGATR